MTARAFTVASLAAEWECSQGAIRKLVTEGRLGHFRIGTLIRIPFEEVRRFECQNTRSSDSEAGMQSSIEMPPESDTERSYKPPTALGLKRRLGGAGTRGATVHHGPWGE